MVLIILGFHRGLIQRPNIGIQQKAQAGDEARCEACSLISTQSERIEWGCRSEARKGRVHLHKIRWMPKIYVTGSRPPEKLDMRMRVRFNLNPPNGLQNLLQLLSQTLPFTRSLFIDLSNSRRKSTLSV